MQRMLDGFSGKTYKPRHFIKTKVFKNAVSSALGKSKYKLAKLKILSKNELASLKRLGFKTVGDLFKNRRNVRDENIPMIAEKIVDSSNVMGQKIVDYQRKKADKKLKGKNPDCC
ncbi:MAG: hypothetical protein ACFFDT_38175, partial [Candidatus Hodarchaeota archaeon]